MGASAAIRRPRGAAWLAALVFSWLAWPAAAADFTDSAGRHVTLPAKVERVAPAGAPADTLLLALAPDKMVGLIEPLRPAQAEYLPAARGLAAIPHVSRKVSPAEIEAFKALKSDLIVDFGDITPAYVAAADRIAAATGVPYIIVSGYVADTPAALRTLGRILGREERGEAAARAAESVIARLKPVASLGIDRRPGVYYARGVDGLKSVRPGTTLADAIDAAGGRNVVPAGKGAFATMTVDEVEALAPAVVIVADPRAAAPDSALRRALPASTRFLVDRGMPFHWLDEPPSINRVIGALWLASKLHPDAVTFGAKDAETLTRALLGVTVNAEQIAAMMK